MAIPEEVFQKAHALAGKGFPKENDMQELATRKPLLAHYTNTRVLESVLRNNEIWFSNPLFMNDLEEIRAGVALGASVFERSLEIGERIFQRRQLNHIQQYFTDLLLNFQHNDAMDIYVLCLTEHELKNSDGLLSMWRAYGGYGNGAALIFKSELAYTQPTSPIFYAKVIYASLNERRRKLEDLVKLWWENIRELDYSDDAAWTAVYRLVSEIRLFSLTHKHDGFHEEREWRLIYDARRDLKKLLTDRLSYLITPTGVEPKLKLKIQPMPWDEPNSWSLDDILHSIILGPNFARAEARKGVEYMLKEIGRENLAEKIRASTIPLRPTS